MSKRIPLLDALRGLSILLMVAYHMGYNLVVEGYLSAEILYGPVLAVLQPLFAGVFIVLAGVSSRFSRNNTRRGLICLACAAVISAVTAVMGSPIWFGILHLLAACMLLYARLPKLYKLGPLWGVVFVVAYLFLPWWPALPSADWFPLLPWLFLFLFGAWLGGFVRDGKMPGWVYAFDMPVLPAVGRRTLLIYMLHQPVLYGIMALTNVILRGTIS